MSSIRAPLRVVQACAVAVILIGCPQGSNKQKPSKPIYCDSEVTVDATKGPQPDPVYVCAGDKLKWKKGNGTNTFSIDFPGATPFTNGKHFDDGPGHETGQGRNSYTVLEVDKYNVIVNGSTHFDPQVVAGGNP